MKFFLSISLTVIMSLSVFAQPELEKGKAAFQKQSYDDAITIFQSFLSQNTRNVEANFYLGESYRMKGDLQNAQNALERTLDFNDEYEPALASLIRVYGKLGLWDKAQKKYNEAAKYNKKGVAAPLAFAQTYLETDSLDKASIYFSKVKDNEEKNADAYVGLAEVYARQNVIVLAVDNLRTATQIRPGDPTLWYKLASTILKNRSLNADQIREVTAALQKSIDLDPKNEKAVFDAANTFYRIKYWREAASFFQKYVELKKDNPEAWEKYGTAAFNAKAFTDAIPALEKAIAMNKNVFDLKMMLANGYYFLQDFKKSIDVFKTLPPDSLGKDEYYRIGVSYYKLKDTSNALANFEIANQKDTVAAIAAGDLAGIYVGQKKYDHAVKQYEKLLVRDPENVTALFFIGFSHSVLGNIEAAKNYFQKFVMRRPTNIMGRTYLAQMYSLEDSVDIASEQYNIVIALADSSMKAESDPKKIASSAQSIVGAYRALALFDYKAKNFKLSIEKLLKGVALEPKNKPDEALHLFLAQMYAVYSGDPQLLAEEARGIKKKACDEYKFVLKINPKNPNAKKESAQMGCEN